MKLRSSQHRFHDANGVCETLSPFIIHHHYTKIRIRPRANKRTSKFHVNKPPSRQCAESHNFPLAPMLEQDHNLYRCNLLLDSLNVNTFDHQQRTPSSLQDDY